jgi:hypothetical protein
MKAARVFVFLAGGRKRAWSHREIPLLYSQCRVYWPEPANSHNHSTGGFDSLTVGDAITLAKELRLTAAEANNYFCPNYVPAETEANIE